MTRYCGASRPGKFIISFARGAHAVPLPLWWELLLQEAGGRRVDPGDRSTPRNRPSSRWTPASSASNCSPVLCLFQSAALIGAWPASRLRIDAFGGYATDCIESFNGALKPNIQ